MDDFITYLWEVVMHFGLYQTTACIAFIILLWRLPNIINAVTEYRKLKK